MTLDPPLKWVGGKRWQVPHLLPLWTPHARTRLVEPFSGGLAVALGLHPARALLNDWNHHLINFYQQVQRGLTVTIALRNDERLYYQHRARFNELALQSGSSSPDAAQLFYFLNRTGYNGLCRFNQSGEFNVPFGRYKTVTYQRSFQAHQERFKPWDFTARDFEGLLLEHDDFVYADPPYDTEFTAFTAEGFTWKDQVRCAEWLARHRGPVVASNQATKRIVKLYRELGFDITYLSAPRRIACNGDRARVKEMLATRNL